MAVVYLIRHGESEGNAGGISPPNLSDVGLTSSGLEQAEEVSVRLLNEGGKLPTLIVASHFKRAQQTALPTRQKYPEIPFETWDNIHEFTYLDPKKMIGTTVAQREEPKKEYWKVCNPDYQDGGSAESFSQFMQRVRDSLEKLKSLPEESSVFVFGHEQFFQAIRLLASFPKATDQELMTKFRDLTGNTPADMKKDIECSRIKNGQIIKSVISDTGILLSDNDKIRPVTLEKRAPFL